MIAPRSAEIEVTYPRRVRLLTLILSCVGVAIVGPCLGAYVVAVLADEVIGYENRVSVAAGCVCAPAAGIGGFEDCVVFIYERVHSEGTPVKAVELLCANSLRGH